MSTTELEPIEYPLKDLGDDLRNKIIGIVGTYSVALTCEGQACGSGTLVYCNGVYGILTAAHVVSESPIEIGEGNRDLGIPFLDEPTRFDIPCKYLSEVVIGKPENGNYTSSGPDATFIRLPESGEYVGWLKAKKDFWNISKQLDAHPNIDNRKTCYLTGYPVQFKSSWSEGNAKFTNHQPIMLGDTLRDSEYRDEGDFDYIDAVVDFTNVPGLPTDYQGMSGGGVWLFKFVHYKKYDVYRVEEPQLCGVVFYQEFPDDGTALITSHMHKAIELLPSLLRK